MLSRAEKLKRNVRYIHTFPLLKHCQGTTGKRARVYYRIESPLFRAWRGFFLVQGLEVVRRLASVVSANVAE